ncbi:MAG: HAMP domain-containing histidine kinase [Muribaculaceae bacterium]|nr:HAMP domain-containing histidine kinase [Muribaculaceae bacterium]
MWNGLKLKNLVINNTARYIFLGITVCAIIFFLIASNRLVKQLASQERERMDIWAQATQRLAQADVDTDVDFLLSIISQNNSIPVLVSDSNYNILDFRNFDLPDETDEETVTYEQLSAANRDYLSRKLYGAVGNQGLEEMSKNDSHFIRVEVYYNYPQYIYYEDSILLRRLSWYPYLQLIVMLILAVIIYSAIIYTKNAEQNRLWAGLSKETAHQLGTPISSLMAWNEYLDSSGTDHDITSEMNKDIKRLSVIADRFSKIGSRPELNLEYLNSTIGKSLEYMASRISGKVKITLDLPPDDTGVMISEPLFEWVMENLTKNAVDAMAGEGEITISTGTEKGKVWIDIKDTGKGISRKNFKKVFAAGYTTKKRGWGLGLTLVKRIIEEYHGGKIYVKSSELGKGTTFRIELPSEN